MKKCFVMLYPGFCNFEIAALTEILAFEEDWQVSTVGADAKLYAGEDGLQVMAQQAFSQVSPLDADLLILPGIDDHHFM